MMIVVVLVWGAWRIVGRFASGISAMARTMAMSAITATNTVIASRLGIIRSSSVGGTVATVGGVMCPAARGCAARSRRGSAARTLTYGWRMDEVSGSRATAEAQRPGMAGRTRALRATVCSVPGGAVVWRVGITVIGLAIIAGGVLLLPLPGPGWLIIFGGLGLLATEYEWAARLLRSARTFVGRWTQWTARQGLSVRIVVGLLGLLFLAGALFGSWYLYTRI